MNYTGDFAEITAYFEKLEYDSISAWDVVQTVSVSNVAMADYYDYIVATVNAAATDELADQIYKYHLEAVAEDEEYCEWLHACVSAAESADYQLERTWCRVHCFLAENDGLPYRYTRCFQILKGHINLIQYQAIRFRTQLRSEKRTLAEIRRQRRVQRERAEQGDEDDEEEVEDEQDDDVESDEGYVSDFEEQEDEVDSGDDGYDDDDDDGDDDDDEDEREETEDERG